MFVRFNNSSEQVETVLLLQRLGLICTLRTRTRNMKGNGNKCLEKITDTTKRE